MVDMKDLRELVPTNGQGGKRDPEKSRDCSVCHESWTVPPTSQEIKRGVVDPVMVCLAKPIQSVMLDGVYPRLTTLCRSDKTLCGGKLWKPIGPPLIADPARPFMSLRHIKDEATDSRPKKQGQYGRRPRVEEEGDDNEHARKKGNERFRKPYEVS